MRTARRPSTAHTAGPTAAAPEGQPSPRASAPIDQTVAVPAGELRRMFDRPNARVQLAHDVRERLEGVADRTPTATWLKAALSEGRLGNAPLLSFVEAVTPDPLLRDARKVVDALLSTSTPELERWFPAPRPLRTTRLETLRDPSTEATLALGRCLTESLVEAAMSGRLDENQRGLLLDTEHGPASLGRLAEAMGVKTPRAFMQAIRRAPTDELTEWKGFLIEDLYVRRALPPPRAPREPMTSARLESLAEDPLASAALSALVERAAAFTVTTFGREPEVARARATTDLAEACQQLAAAMEELRSAFGGELAEHALRATDVELGLGPEPHVAASGRLVGEGMPWAGSARVERLREELGRRAMESVGLELLKLMKREPALARVVGLLEAASEGARAFVLAELVTRAADVPDAETAAEHSLAVGRTSRALGVEELLARMCEEHGADPTGFEHDLAAFVSQVAGIERSEARARRDRQHLARELDAGVLALPHTTLRSVYREAELRFPEEALGYLLTDGVLTRFVAVRNCSPQPTRHGLPDEQDLARLHRLLSATGLAVLAWVHSHPSGRPVFSDGDLAGMSSSVALAPGRRTFIVGISAERGGFDLRPASFSSDAGGQVISEDHIDVR